MSNKFFIKTTLEWASTSMNSYIIPRGDLCIETFDDGNMKLKIGDGLRVFKQLPYICHGHDDKKYDYYTKEEIDKMFDDITIDLDNYYNKNEINEFMTSLRSDLIQYVDNNTHYHHNKAILDQITAPFTREEKEKLANIIDVSGYAERIEVLESIAHTHDNKNVLDLITLADVNNWHVHSNKTILDNTTASFTVNYKNILDNLVTYNVFEPASAYESGSVGLVPAPNVGDHVKFLRGDGKWVSIEVATIPIATTETLGGIIVGDGLTITPEGVLSANAQQSGVLDITNTYDVLNIVFEDDTKYIKLYNPGDGIEFENASSGSTLAPRIKYFRFDISKIRGNDQWVQMEELEFSHNGTVVRGDGVSITGYKFDGSTPTYSTTGGAQTPVQLIDNDLNTKMCARFDDDQHSYIKIILSINGEGISPNEVFKYQYFTGDDEPNRDPVSWTVYVSADGVRWILVDQRDNATINTARNAPAFDKITLDMTDYINAYADRTFTNINVKPATTTDIGGIIVGDGINVDENGVISVDSHDVVEYLDGDAIELRDVSVINAPFIRFNGSTSVFDTGVIHQAHDKFEVILREPNVSNKNRTVFGSRIYNIDSNDVTLTINSNQKFAFDRSSTARTILESTNTVSTDIIYKVIIQDKSCDIYNYETGELIEHIGDAEEWVLDDGLYTLSIGNVHNSDYMQHSNLFGDMELYEFKWYRNDTLIHDYVPYQNESLVALYDNVTESVLQAYAGANGLTYGTREIHISDLGSDKSINVLYADGLAINDNNQLYTTGVLDVSVNPTDDSKLNITFWDEVKTIKIAGTKYTPGEAIDISTESLDSDYIEIEYIETSNPNNTRDFGYFDTGYIPGPTTNIELVIAPSRGATEYTPAGITRYDNGSYATHVFGIAWNSTTGTGVWFNRADQTSNYGGQYVELSENIRNKKTTFKTVGNTLYVYNENGDLLGSVTDSDAFTANAPYSLPIFVSKIHNDSPYSNDFMYGKFYELYIREGDELIHHFIPCKTSDQTAFGIYDTITKSFIQISKYGTGGQINLGPEVSERRSETKINVLYDDGLDVNNDNELINTGVLDVNVNEQDSSKLDIEFYDHTKTITIPSGYELLPATAEVLGGIIVGNGLSITEEGVLSADAITIDDYVISVTQDEEFSNILHVEYPDGTVDITLPQSEGKVEVDEPEEELIISGSYGPVGEIYTAGAGISITKASGDDRHLPDAYKQIQYIDSNEFTQFLDTEILVIPGIKVECDCEVSDEVQDAYQGIFGTKYANTYNCFIFWTRFGGQNIPCFASPSSGEVTGTGFIYNTRIKIVATQSGASWYFNDSLVGSINGSGNWSYDKPIILFGCAKEGRVESGCKAKCYEFKAYNGDTLTNDLIPCVEIATGEVGMYDLIANKFCKAVDDGVTRAPFVAGPDLIADSYITNTGVLDIAVNEEDETVLDVTFYNETKHIQMSGGSSYDDTELRSLISALTTQVQTLQTELNTLKTKAVLSDDIKHIDKVTMDEYMSMVRSNDTMYLINDDAGELEPSSSVVPTDTLATSMDNVDIMIIGDLEEVE